MRLHRQRLKQEFLVELLLRRVAENSTFARIILQWAARTPHHLQHIRYRVFCVPVFASIVSVRAHDDSQLR